MNTSLKIKFKLSDKKRSNMTINSISNNLFIVFLLGATSLLFAQNKYTYKQPTILSDSWNTNHLDSLSIDTNRMFSLLNELQKGNHKIHSILLIKDQNIILEEYYGDYTFQEPHDLRSVTKSVRSLLLGIAIKEGFIESVDDPISKYLKTHVPQKNLDPRKENITIANLLTMSSGLECNDWDKKSKGQEDKVYKKKDWIQYTLDLPMVHEPGTVSKYCSMGVLLIAEIIGQASGMSIDKFANTYLFEPLGIKNVQWGHTSNKPVIPSGKRLYITPRDMAKIGQLILNKGVWNEKQIVSEKWLEESTLTKTKITGMNYGYLWWNIIFKIQGKAISSIVATGNGGQYIMIFPEFNLIAVFTGGAYNSPDDKAPFTIMNKVFLPAIIAK